MKYNTIRRIFTVITILFIFGLVSVITASAGNMLTLQKTVIDVKFQLGDQPKGTIQAIQYAGVVKKATLKSDQVNPFFEALESKNRLNDFLKVHNYSLPNMNFDDNYVYIVWGVQRPPYLDPQITQLKITAIRYDNGKLSNVASSFVLSGGQEKAGTFSFVVLIIPKGAIQ